MPASLAVRPMFTADCAMHLLHIHDSHAAAPARLTRFLCCHRVRHWQHRQVRQHADVNQLDCLCTMRFQVQAF